MQRNLLQDSVLHNNDAPKLGNRYYEGVDNQLFVSHAGCASSAMPWKMGQPLHIVCCKPKFEDWVRKGDGLAVFLHKLIVYEHFLYAGYVGFCAEVPCLKYLF